jgi:spore coat protein A, manganese oxidase
MPNRRDFLKTGVLAGAGAVLVKGASQRAVAAPPAGSPKIKPFVDPLFLGIPKLTPGANPAYPGADYYEITMQASSWKFSSQHLGPAATLSYGPMPYLGPTIEAQSGRPVVVKFINNLPPLESQHPLAASIDPTVPDPAMYQAPDGTPLPGGRAVPHLHGGFTPPQFDGHPHSWFTPGTTANGHNRGSHYGSLPGAALNEAILAYPNNQPASMIWYHDHAMGITRLNVYAGLAGLYFIRDLNDTGVAGTGLNLPAGPYEVPLVIQDKQFNPNGTLFYPTMGITAVHPIWMPEFFGDTPVVNAVAYPFLNVEPRRYRFRVVNGSQARFYNLSLNGASAGSTPFYVIGMEQSLLPAPVAKTSLLLAPGERADIIVDFTGKAGKTFTLKNNAKAPYPGGQGGSMPDIMQFRVVTPLAGPDTSVNPAIPGALALPAVPPLVATTTAPMREIVMKEDVDPVTGLPIDMKLNGKWFDDLPLDETPMVNDTEIWQFINLTVDAHPMHMHLVKFQVSDRQPFNAKAYTAAWNAFQATPPLGPRPVLANFFTGPAVPPPPEERGWKDTAKAYPGEILRVIAKFEVQNSDIPNIPGTAAALPAEYVYHCHILEHEENEMMRPFAVTVDGLPPVPVAARADAQEASEDRNGDIPTRFELHQNYPNPFNPETTIRFDLPKDAPVSLKVFNSAGQEVATLADGSFAAGSHSVQFSARNLSSGVYYCRINAGGFVATQKMVLVR